MKKVHEIEKLDFDGDTMCLVVDGQRYTFRLPEVSTRLANATETQRRFFRFSPSGYGIHWPEIDEDLSIDGLIKHQKTYKPAQEPTVLREDKTDFKP